MYTQEEMNDLTQEVIKGDVPVTVTIKQVIYKVKSTKEIKEILLPTNKRLSKPIAKDLIVEITGISTDDIKVLDVTPIKVKSTVTIG